MQFHHLPTHETDHLLAASVARNCHELGLVISWVAVTEKVDVQLLTLLMVGSWGWTMHYGRSLPSHITVRN